MERFMLMNFPFSFRIGSERFGSDPLLPFRKTALPPLHRKDESLRQQTDAIARAHLKRTRKNEKRLNNSTLGECAGLQP